MKHFASLKDARNFIRVFNQGRSLRGSQFRVHYLRNEVGETRIGIVITRKAGSAVVRNLLRRRLRNIIRCAPIELKNQYDIVIYISSSITGVPFKVLEAETIRLLSMLEGG